MRTRFLLLIVFMIGLTSLMYGQSDGDYRSKQSGGFGLRANWQRYYSADPAGWKDYDAVNYPFSAPNNTNGVITILSEHRMSVTSNRTIDQLDVNGTLVVNQSVTLTINDGTGTDLNVDGETQVSGAIVNNGQFVVNGTLIDVTGAAVSGSGSFSLSSGATLETKNVDGIHYEIYNEEEETYSYYGFIQCTGNISISNNSNIIFSHGYGNQSTWAIPSTVSNLTINNLGDYNVVLSDDITITTRLIYIRGDVNVNGNTIVYSSGATLEYRGSTAAQSSDDGCFPTTNGPTHLVTKNSYGTTIHDTRTLSGNLSLTSGTCTITSGKTLTVNGTTTKTGGSITGGTFVTDGYIETANNISIAENDNNITGLSVSMTTPSNYPSRVDRQWSISGTFSGTKSITLTWTNTDDHDFDWSGKEPAVYVGSTKYTGSYSIGSPNRTITVTVGANFSKADITIGQSAGDGTLPVELSSLTATATSYGYVNIEWVTQSETGVQGFYIYRNVINNLASALVVSPSIAATNTSQEAYYSFLDREVPGDGLYYYWLENRDINGESEFHGPISATVDLNGSDNPVIPLSTRLNAPYPNPFNPNISVAFDIAKAQHVQIYIYNAKGQKIRTLLDSTKNPGIYRIVWDGKADNGAAVSTGVYFIKMNAGSFKDSRKIIMVK